MPKSPTSTDSQGIASAADTPAVAESIHVDHRGVVLACSKLVGDLLSSDVSDLIGHSLSSLATFRCRQTGQPFNGIPAANAPEDEIRRLPQLDICFATGECFPLSIRRISGQTETSNGIELTFQRSACDKVRFSDDLILLHSTARMAQVGGWELEPATGKVRWTEQTFRIHDLEAGEPPRLADALSFYVPEDRKTLEDAIYQALMEGSPYDLELRLRTAKGRLRYTRSICRPVKSDGRTIRLIGTIQDITDRKKTEAELLESESRYRDLFENNNAIKLLIDPSTLQIVEVNSAAVEFYGYSIEEFRSLKISDLNLAEELDVRSAITAVRDHKVSELEFKHRLASGEVRDVKVHTGTITLNKQTLVHSIVFDITERKRAQEAVDRMQQLESLGTLAGGIAHDFNNVLTAVLGNLSIMKHTLDSEHPAMKFLQNAEHAVERATGLSRQLLTFAKGDAPIRQNVSLAELITDVIHFDLSGSNVTPVLKFAPGLWNLHVDPTQLQQVFSNLTINANQSMPEGGCLQVAAANVVLDADEIPGIAAGEFVKVTFHDHGHGIDQKDLPRIFDPYFSTKPTGNGLGLATSYSIIQKHKGHIEVTSQLELGTTFTIFLPAILKQHLTTKTSQEPFEFWFLTTK